MNGVTDPDIEQHTLFETHAEIVNTVDRFVAAATEDVVLDIAAFPKRFFFPIVKRLLSAGTVRSLLVTYTDASAYGPLPLSEDAEPVDVLPLYGTRYPEPPTTALVVALGFQPLGLAEILEGTGTDAVHLLFPYPSDPENRYRVWDFVRGLAETLPGRARRMPTFVSPLDTSDAFDRLVTISDQMRGYLGLAPFGPKPISLAMALAADAADWPVFYTQPRIYRPDYSAGVRYINGAAATYGYCVRLDGRNLYSRPT